MTLVDQQRDIDVIDIVSRVAVAKGNMHLVAEQLHITTPNLLAILANDPNAYDLLSKAFRTVALLDTFTAVEFLLSEVAEDAALDNAAPQDKVKALSATSTLFSDLTRNNTVVNNNLNIFDKVMAMLPPEAREAVKALAAVDNGRAAPDVIDQPATAPSSSGPPGPRSSLVRQAAHQHRRLHAVGDNDAD